jgi:aminopeptidase N
MRMRPNSLLLLSFIVFLTLRLGAQIDCSHFQKACRADGAVALSESVSNQEDIQYMWAEWWLDPSVRYLRGVVRFRASVTGSTYDSLRLKLSNALAIDSIRVNDQSAGYRHQSDALVIAVAGATGVPFQVQIAYRGVPSNSGFGSFVQSQTPAGRPIIWTLSEPFGAFDWWPVKPGLQDKIDSSDYVFHIPSDCKAASHGTLIADSLEIGGRVMHWRHRYPIAPYLVAMAVSPYVEIVQSVPLQNESAVVLNYCYPEWQAEWEGRQAMVRDMLQYYDSLFTPYPFAAEKYGHAQFGWGGGMEHQTMSFMADLGPWLSSHELAHQWFGNSVTCGSWSDIWLNEGFATYLTGLYFERFDAAAFPSFRRDLVNEIQSEPDGSVWVADTQDVSRIFSGRLTYYKGAMVLHMLRRYLGDAAFFVGCRAYLQHPNLQYGYVHTQDLQQAMESASGRDLEPFFSRWVYGEGYAKVQVEWQVLDSGLRLVIAQEGSSETEWFPMVIPLRLRMGLDSLDVWVRMEGPRLDSVWSVPGAVTQVVADPDKDVLGEFVVKRLSGNGNAGYLYPVPSTGVVYLDLAQPGWMVRAQLRDGIGRLVGNSWVPEQESGRIRIKIPEGLSGLYWIELEDVEGGVWHYRVVLVY